MWLWQNKTDEEVISLIREGEEKVLAHLYRQNYSMVRNYVMENSGTLDDVDDMLQDGVIAVWKNVSKRDFELKAKLSTYFLAVVKNLWLKKLRKNKKMSITDENNLVLIGSYVEQNTAQKMDMAAIRSLLNEIGDTCKELLGLFYFEQMDNKSISERMNFSNSAVVKAKKYQCLQKLKIVFNNKYQVSDFK